jgi:hypothetical protein
LDQTESRLSKIRADFNITLTDVRCQVSWLRLNANRQCLDADWTAQALIITLFLWYHL